MRAASPSHDRQRRCRCRRCRGPRRACCQRTTGSQRPWKSASTWTTMSPSAMVRSPQAGPSSSSSPRRRARPITAALSAWRNERVILMAVLAGTSPSPRRIWRIASSAAGGQVREIGKGLVLDLALLAVGAPEQVGLVDLVLVDPPRGNYMQCPAIAPWHAAVPPRIRLDRKLLVTTPQGTSLVLGHVSALRV